MSSNKKHPGSSIPTRNAQSLLTYRRFGLFETGAIDLFVALASYILLDRRGSGKVECSCRRVALTALEGANVLYNSAEVGFKPSGDGCPAVAVLAEGDQR